jgi:hypothetical protein
MELLEQEAAAGHGRAEDYPKKRLFRILRSLIAPAVSPGRS